MFFENLINYLHLIRSNRNIKDRIVCDVNKKGGHFNEQLLWRKQLHLDYNLNTHLLLLRQ